jgi:hypothetical protein
MFKFLKKVFHKETEIEKEEKLEQEIIKEVEKETAVIEVTGIIIKYILNDEDEVPVIVKIADFHNNVMPDPGSIIWASNGKNLTPYTVIRYDFIEDPDLEKGIAQMTYIVVKDALNTDILKTSY